MRTGRICGHLVHVVSLCTHFFNELVEADILYFALFPGRGDNFLAAECLAAAPNQLAELLPEMAVWSEAVKVIETATESFSSGRRVIFNANTPQQQAVCYWGDFL